MSLWGALNSGVSGLTAQSSAMGATSDNIANINTVGYKDTQTHFSTLVTKQVSLNSYSSGGVKAVSRSNVNAQGLLTSTNYTTDLAISGDGFFVVNTSSQAGIDGSWAYTRQGDFYSDDAGNLKNTGGYYLYGWSIMKYDSADANAASATLIEWNNELYVKAYTNANGTVTYVNDSIIDDRNLQPVNVETISGGAEATKNISMGMNLPSSAEIYSASTASTSNLIKKSVEIYDSLGTTSNLTLTFTKASQMGWDINCAPPTGAASLSLYSSRETYMDAAQDVYASAGQLEFKNIPSNHESFSITVSPGTADEHTYTFEFLTSAAAATSQTSTADNTVVGVNISSSSTATEATSALLAAVKANLPSSARFSSDGSTLLCTQSLGGTALKFNASNCPSAAQSAAGIDSNTGIASGEFTVDEISWNLKNAGVVNFESTTASDYYEKSVVLDNKVYVFYDSGDAGGAAIKAQADSAGAIAVNVNAAVTGTEINPNLLVSSCLMPAISQNDGNPTRYTASGRSLEIAQVVGGGDLNINLLGNQMYTTTINTGLSVAANLAAYEGKTVEINGTIFEFDTNAMVGGGNTAVNISGLASTSLTALSDAIMSALKQTIDNTFAETVVKDYQVDGNTLITPHDANIAAGVGTLTDYFAAGFTPAIVSGTIKNDGNAEPVDILSTALTLSSKFTFNGVIDSEEGGLVAGVKFGSDGLPEYFNVSDVAVSWATGAQDMNDAISEGDGAMINLFFGNVGTSDGLTSFAGDYGTPYISQDGKRFGNFESLEITEDGMVVAVYDNGQMQPIAQIPLATFTNPNGLEALSGNAWIETSLSGSASLSEASSGSTGSIESGSLESSTVDLGAEFTTMITTQKAYSAASKIISTAADMLDDLISIKR